MLCRERLMVCRLPVAAVRVLRLVLLFGGYLLSMVLTRCMLLMECRWEPISIFLTRTILNPCKCLKDASAAAIYGTRGSNGVVLITTKKGKKGATQFGFSASAGFQTLKKPEMAKASEYEYVFKARYINDNAEPRYNSKENITDAEGTDWWE